MRQYLQMLLLAPQDDKNLYTSYPYRRCGEKARVSNPTSNAALNSSLVNVNSCSFAFAASELIVVATTPDIRTIAMQSKAREQLIQLIP